MEDRFRRKITPEMEEFTKEELIKHAEMQVAQRILDELGANITLEWVREEDSKELGRTRRVIQMVG